MNPLRILILTNRIPWPLNDGGAIAMFNAAKYLSLRGHQITFACLNTKKHRQDPKVLSSVGRVFSVDIDTSLKPLPALLGMFSGLPYNVSRFRSKEFENLLKGIIEKEKFDIVQFEGIYLALYSSVFKNGKAKRVLRAHNVESQIWKRLSETETKPLKKFYLSSLARKIEKFEKQRLHDFDAIVPITELDEKFFRDENFKGLIETVNAGVDTDVFRHGANEKPSSVCFLGSLEWRPNLEGLKWFVDEIWPKVRAKNPAATLEVAGKNPPSELSWLSGPGINFHGMVPDANEFLSRSGIFVTPLRSGSGMRLKIVEAMAAGKAIVSTSIGAEGIVFTPGSEIRIEDNADSFAVAILELLNNPERQKEMGSRARKIAVEKYSWPALAEKMEGVYRRLL